MKGEKLFEKQLSGLNAQMDKLLDKIGKAGVKYYQGNFARQGMDGNNWAPKKKDDGNPILVKTWLMFDSITYEKRGKDVFVVCDVPYAKYVNDGTDRMPARRFLGESKELVEILNVLIDKEMRNFLKD